MAYCNCGGERIVRISGTAKNPGRLFYACPYLVSCSYRHSNLNPRVYMTQIYFLTVNIKFNRDQNAGLSVGLMKRRTNHLW